MTRSSPRQTIHLLRNLINELHIHFHGDSRINWMIRPGNFPKEVKSAGQTKRGFPRHFHTVSLASWLIAFLLRNCALSSKWRPSSRACKSAVQWRPCGCPFPSLFTLDPVRLNPLHTASFKQYPAPQTQRSIPTSKSLLAALWFALILLSIPLLRFQSHLPRPETHLLLYSHAWS